MTDKDKVVRFKRFLDALTVASKETGLKIDGQFGIEPLDDPSGLYAMDMNMPDEPLFAWMEIKGAKPGYLTE